MLGRGEISPIVKMHIFFKDLLFIQAYMYIRQTTCKSIVIMTKEGSTTIVNFMTPAAGAGVLVMGHGRIVIMQYFFSSSCVH